MKKIGDWAEDLACQFAQDKGWRLVQRHYYSRYGEIDLIMQDAETLIFVEVKARSSARFGEAIEMVTTQKQQKMILTAQVFLQSYPEYENLDCRFDVVGISWQKTVKKQELSLNLAQKYELQWIENAFTL